MLLSGYDGPFEAESYSKICCADDGSDAHCNNMLNKKRICVHMVLLTRDEALGGRM